MRCLVALVLVLSPSVAFADVIAPPLECPRGQMPGRYPGCPSHGGGGGECVPAWCADDASCGEGQRCVPVARCVETIEMRCVSGDGRNPDSQREYTVQHREEGGPCGADDACPGDSRCEHFRECQPAPSEPAPVRPTAETAAPAPAPASSERPPGGMCTIGRSRATPSLGLVLLALVALGVARRRRR